MIQVKDYKIYNKTMMTKINNTEIIEPYQSNKIKKDLDRTVERSQQ